METTISNSIKIISPSLELEDWIEQNMIFKNPLYQRLKNMGKDDLIVKRRVPEKINLVSNIRGVIEIPFGVLYSIWPLVKKGKVSINFNENGNLSFKDEQPTEKLFDYQEKAVQKMIDAKGGILTCGCGGGKTYMGIEIIRRLGKKALWLCHTGDLLNQAKQDMLDQYPMAKIGLTTEGKLEIGEDITISTVQTLVNVDPYQYQDKFDIVVIDECAHVAGDQQAMKQFAKVVSKIKARYKYGLTATPFRSDGLANEMYAYIGVNPNGSFEPTYFIPPEEIKTILSEHRKIEISSGYGEELFDELYDASGMLIYNNLINELCNNDERTNKIISNVVKCNAENRKQVILTLRKEHCKTILEKLLEKNVKAVLCTGDVQTKKRKQILNQEIDWDVIVATYSLLKEGISISELDTLHLATPIKSQNDKGGQIIQCAGRIERFLPNKKQPIVYDYVDVDIPYCEKAYVSRRRALKRRMVIPKKKSNVFKKSLSNE